MRGKHQSSVLTFLGIYLAVLLILGGALFFLYRSTQRDRQQTLLATDIAAVSQGDSSRVIPTNQKPIAKPEEPTNLSQPEEPKSKNKQANDAISSTKPVAPEKPVASGKATPPSNPELDAEIESMYPMPKVRPLLEIVENWKSVPQKAFPPFVKIRVPVEFEIKGNGTVVGKGKLPSGSSMIPLRLLGDTLTLSSSLNSSFTVTLSVSDTDFRERIQARYDTFIVNQTNNVLAQRRAEKKRRSGVIEKENSLSVYNEGDDSRFDPVKASIRRGEAGFFQIESARKWRWAGEETIEGESFHVAFVMMVSESAFGTSKRELKALIQDEKVVSWIDVTTGEKL